MHAVRLSRALRCRATTARARKLCCVLRSTSRLRYTILTPRIIIHMQLTIRAPLSGSTLGCSRVLIGVLNRGTKQYVPGCRSSCDSVVYRYAEAWASLLNCRRFLAGRLSARTCRCASRTGPPEQELPPLRPGRGYTRLIADRSLLRGRPRPFPGGPLGTGPPFVYQPAVSGASAAWWWNPANEGDDTTTQSR